MLCLTALSQGLAPIPAATRPPKIDVRNQLSTFRSTRAGRPLSSLRDLTNLASPSSTQVKTGAQRRRRTSSATRPPPQLDLQEQSPSSSRIGASSGFPTGGYAQPLPTIPGTPYGSMSLSRSPSPRRGGGWSSPGLTSPYDNVSGNASPRKTYGDIQTNGLLSSDDVTWAKAKARSEEVKGYPSFSTRNNGFFSRHARKISTSLPTFRMTGRRDFSDKERLGRGRWAQMSGSRTGRFLTYLGRTIWRLRLRLGIFLAFLLAIILFYVTREYLFHLWVLACDDISDSHASSVSKSVVLRRWQQIRGHTGSESGRRCHGMERCS